MTAGWRLEMREMTDHERSEIARLALGRLYDVARDKGWIVQVAFDKSGEWSVDVDTPERGFTERGHTLYEVMLRLTDLLRKARRV